MSVAQFIAIALALWLAMSLTLGLFLGLILHRLDRRTKNCAWETEADGQRIRYEARTAAELRSLIGTAGQDTQVINGGCVSG